MWSVESNHLAVKSLMDDAECALELIRLEDVRRDGAEGFTAIQEARLHHVNLGKRRPRLVLTEDEDHLFQDRMDHLQAALRFYGEWHLQAIGSV